MKCPKCSYVSHDYLDACRKCGVELVSFKKNMGLLVLQPGVLDLSLVLGEARGDDLFASMGEEIARHVGNDDDFEIHLDDEAHPAAAQPAHVEAPWARAREAAEGSAGLDHLTLELDVSALPAGLAASLSSALDLSDAPPTSPTPGVPPPGLPGGSMPPGDETLNIESDSGSIALPSGALAAFVATPVEGTQMAESGAEEHAEGGDEVARAAEIAAAVVSAQAQDIVLAEDPSVVPEEQDPVTPDLAVPIIVDEPDLEEVSLLSALEFEPDASALGAEMMRSSLAMTTLDDAALTFLDEDVPPTQPSHELTATTGDTTSEDALISADIAAIEDSEAPALPADLTLDLSPPETGPAPGAVTLDTFPEDALIAADMSALEDSEAPTLPADLTLDLSSPETGPAPGAVTLDTLADTLALGALDDTTVPGHLTLDFDISALRANLSSATPDDVRPDDPPGDVQSEMSPPQNQAGAEEELLLDLDNIEFDDDTKA